MKNKIKKHLKDFSCEDASLKEEASEPIRQSFEFSSSPRVGYSKLQENNDDDEEEEVEEEE